MRLAALLLCLAGAADAQVTSATYDAATTRYPHGALGDAIEWGELRMKLSGGRTMRVVLPEDRVFEDVAPRVVDVDLDGHAEVVVVESSVELGARLAIYDPEGLVAATPFIGRRFRWLAPVGAADLDGDGRVELAYVDQPHLAKILRVWRFADGSLRQVVSAQGYTNHRIGEREIAGGIRECGQGPEMVVADAAWTEVVAVSFVGSLNVQRLSAYNGPASFETAMACR